MGTKITTKCTDWVNVSRYVKLEDYLVYLKGASYTGAQGIYAVNKETGEREEIVTIGSFEDPFWEMGHDLCVENLCGVGNILYVFGRKKYWKINVETGEFEESSIISESERCGHLDPIVRNMMLGSILLTQVQKMNAQCNGQCIVYTVSGTLCMLDIVSGKHQVVRDYRNKEINADSYRLMNEMIYYSNGKEVKAYELSSKKVYSICTLPEYVYVNFFNENISTLNYDDCAVNFYENMLYISFYDEDEEVHRVKVISLKDAVEIKEIEICSSTDSEEIVGKLLFAGNLYYVTANEEALIVKYDLESEEELILEENSLCVILEGKGRKRYYTVGTLQIVGDWLYYQDNERENTHRIPLEGGDCVRVRIKE